MARQEIDLTTPQPNGKMGEPTKSAWEKVNDMTAELYPLAEGALPKSGGVVSGDITSTASVKASSFAGASTAVLASAGSTGAVSLRPNGVGSTSGEMYVLGSGDAQVSGNITASGAGFIGSSTARLATSSSGGSISLRPNGYGSTSGEAFVLGNGNMTIAGTLTQNSDYRIKTQVENIDIHDAAASLRQLAPVTYIDMRASEDGRRSGYLAHEATDAGLGLLVSGEKDKVLEGKDKIDELSDDQFASLELQGLNYIGIIPYLHAAWLESDRRVTELEAIVESMRRQS